MADPYEDIYSDLYAGLVDTDPITTTADGIYLEVAWDKATYTNETAYVLPNSSAISAEYGRDQATALAPTVSGVASVVLDNRTRRFSPRNTASPLYGQIKPARPVRVTRVVAGVPYVLFVGYTDDSPINPDVDAKTVTLSLLDSLARFRGEDISTELYTGIRTGQAIGYILDACGWPVEDRDLDTGATVIPWWWEDNTNALEALEKVVRSEGPPAMLFVGADGSIVFRDRHHRLLRTASTTVQQTWGNAVMPINRPFSYDEAWDHIVNQGSATVEVRAPGSGIEQVWTSDATISVAADSSTLITVSGTDPFYLAQTPVEGVDFTVESGAVTASLFRDSGGATTIELTSGGSAAVVTGLQLRAIPIPVVNTVQVAASDETSRDDYGTKSFPGDLPWCGAGDAQAVLKTAVSLRSQPLPIVKVRMLVGRDANRIGLLGRDLGDRVTVQEAETVTNGPFFIESISHDAPSQMEHSVTFGLEAAPTQRSPIIRLNVSGLLGAAYLTNVAIDTENLIILGSNVSGHRLGEGVLAA